MRAALERRLSRYPSVSMRRMRSSIDDDDSPLDRREAQRKQEQHEAAESLKRVTYSRLDTHELDTSALVDLAHGGEQILVVLNDFERLVVTAGDKERAREHCRLLLRGLLETCANIKVLITCSSFSGIGRVPGLGLCGIKFRAPHAIDATIFRSSICAMAWRLTRRCPRDNLIHWLISTQA
tara:strand:- start:85 stop:627 length:543 start_codon:yes stop_codon:yes gene_type:complete